MRAIVREAWKRGGRKPPSLLGERDIERAKGLLNWMNIIHESELQPKGHPETERQERAEGPDSMDMPYKMVFPSQYGYNDVGSIDKRSEMMSDKDMETLLDIMDEQGLLDWVDKTTRSTSLINMAMWYMLDHNGPFAMEEPGYIYRNVKVNDMEKGSWDINVIEVGWAHNTPWWNFVRYVTGTMIGNGLMMNACLDEMYSLYDQIGVSVIDNTVKDRPKFMHDVYEYLGYDMPEVVAANTSINEAQKASIINEAQSRADTLMEEDWIQPWFKNVVVSLSDPPKGTLQGIIHQAMLDDPTYVLLERNIDFNEITRLILRAQQYGSMARKCAFPVRYGYSDEDTMSDLYVNVVAWGEDDLLGERINENLNVVFENYDVTAGTITRRITKGKLLEESDLHLYHAREFIRKKVCQWMSNLQGSLSRPPYRK